MSFTESLDDLVARNENGLLSIHPAWTRARLGEVATVLNGFAFSSSEFSQVNGKPLLRIRDVLSTETEAFYTGRYDDLYLVRPEELIVGMDGDFNCALWKGPEAVLNQRVCKVTPDERFYSKHFLTYALPGYLRAINGSTSSVTVKHLSSRTVQDIPLPLPPREQQNRIVAEIEKQFTRLDAAVAALKRVRANLKRYRAALLKAACEGRLVPTEDARVAPVSELLAEPLANGRSPQKSVGGVPILKLTALRDGTVDLSEIRLGEVPAALAEQLRIRKGDIFISRGNGSIRLVGRAGLVNNAPDRVLMFPDTMIRVRLAKNIVSARYFTYIWNSEFVRRQIERTARTTAGIHKISQVDIGNFVMPLPDVDTQESVVDQLDHRLSSISAAEATASSGLRKAERLRQSILKRAFEGKLVPQDPNDEPASALLERIRAERSERSGSTVKVLRSKKIKPVPVHAQ